MKGRTPTSCGKPGSWWELALKGALRAIGIEPSKFHDVGGLTGARARRVRTWPRAIEERAALVAKHHRICNDIGVYRLRFARDVVADLKKLTAYHRRLVLDAIEEQLGTEPTRPTRNRKVLVNLVPPWTAEPPIWELRVGEHRIFYDVSEAERIGYVRAIRRKPPGRTTEEIL
jgi:mRNA-degrading endonuclease RelE of RelBE toxin-antitoxin system